MTSAIRAVQTFTVPRRPLRRGAVAFGAIGSLLVILVGVARTEEWDAVAALDLACLVGLVWLVALPADWLLHRLSGGRARLHVGPDGLCLEQGGVCQRVPWGAITRVQIKAGEGGEPVEVDVDTAEGRALELREFERLSDIVALIRAGISPAARVEGP